MFELLHTQDRLFRELQDTINELQNKGEEKAEAERDYRVALMEETLKAKADGMSITLIEKTIYGNEKVAESRLERDIAQTNYESTLEKINMIKLKIRVLDEQMNREWHSGQ